MKTKYIIANWKQNPKSIEAARELLQLTAEFNQAQKQKLEKSDETVMKFEIAHAVPSVFAGALATESKEIFAQDIFWAEEGAYTGKFGAAQAKSVGIYMSLIGHSETRMSKANKKGYTDEEVAQKLENLYKNKMWGCLCVGEEVRDKKYKQAIRAQLKASLSKTKAANLKTLCLAYEPVWAIGKDAKRPATPAEIEETVAYIYEVLAELYPSKGNKLTKDIIVLYGGSVDKSNMKDILNIQNVGGLLIGRASSDKKSWKGLLDGFLK